MDVVDPLIFAEYIKTKHCRHACIQYMWDNGIGCPENILFTLPRDLLGLMMNRYFQKGGISFTTLCLVSKQFSVMLFTHWRFKLAQYAKRIETIVLKQEFRKANWNSQVWKVFGFNSPSRMVKAMVNISDYKPNRQLYDNCVKCLDRKRGYNDVYLEVMHCLNNTDLLIAMAVEVIKLQNPLRDLDHVIALINSTKLFDQMSLTNSQIKLLDYSDVLQDLVEMDPANVIDGHSILDIESPFPNALVEKSRILLLYYKSYRKLALDVYDMTCDIPKI